MNKVPVHVLTGFLGSGKTLLLNALLKTRTFANSAVIVNEFGEAGLDHLLFEKSDDQIIELSNGCLCCTVRGQLVDTIETLLEKNPERIIIETTGLADPLPVLQAIIHAPAISDRIIFSGLATIFDCLQGSATLEKQKEAVKQVAMADLICLSKRDMPSALSEDDAENVIRSINPQAKIVSKETLLAQPQLLLENNNLTTIAPANAHHNHYHNVNIHNESICSLTLRHDRPIRADDIWMFLQLLFSAHGNHMLRLKGLIDIAGSEGPLLVQGVGTIMSEPQRLKHWPDSDKTTRIVVFLEDMNPGFIEDLFSGFIGKPQIDVPDRESLTNNPLNIPGLKL